MVGGDFSDLLRYPGVSKDTNNWFSEPGTRPEIPKSGQLGVFGISHNEIEKLLIQSEAEKFYGAFWLFFS